MPVQGSGNGGGSPLACSMEGAAFWVAVRSARVVFVSALEAKSRTLGHIDPWAGGTAFASTFGKVVPTVDGLQAG